MKGIFKNKNFTLICLGTLISSIGDNLYNIALTISIYTLSGSIAAVAGMWLVRACIRIPGQFISGIIADKYNRKKVILFTNLFNTLVAFMFILVSGKNIGFAYILIFLLQATSDIDDTAGMAMLPEIVNKEELPTANSVFTLLTTITLLVSPGLAGFIYIKYGASILFIMNSASFLIAAMIYSMIKYKSTRLDNKEVHNFTLFKFAKEGYSKVINNRVVLITIFVMMSFSLLGRFYDIYKVYVADKILDVGSEGIIYFSYAMAFGSMLTPACIKLIKRNRFKLSTSYLVVSLFSGVGYLFWGFANKMFLSFSSVFILGIFTSAMSVFINSIIQDQIEKEYIGRVFSFYKMSIMISAIFGIVIAPILFDTIGVKYAVSIFAIIAIILVVLFSRLDKRVNEEVNEKVEYTQS